LLRNKEENEYVLMLVEIGELRGITVILWVWCEKEAKYKDEFGEFPH
jgi:hypothetical protein